MPSPPTNYQLANEYIGQIFVLLFDTWPMPTTLKASAVTGIEFDPDTLFCTPPAKQPIEWDICSSLYDWLQREGYIVFDGYSGGSVWDIRGVTLTQKAMECLKQLPNPLNPTKQTFLDSLRETASSGLSDARQQLISQGLSNIFKFISDH